MSDSVSTLSDSQTPLEEKELTRTLPDQPPTDEKSTLDNLSVTLVRECQDTLSTWGLSGQPTNIFSIVNVSKDEPREEYINEPLVPITSVGFNLETAFVLGQRSTVIIENRSEDSKVIHVQSGNILYIAVNNPNNVDHVIEYYSIAGRGILTSLNNIFSESPLAALHISIIDKTEHLVSILQDGKIHIFPVSYDGEGKYPVGYFDYSMLGPYATRFGSKSETFKHVLAISSEHSPLIVICFHRIENDDGTYHQYTSHIERRQCPPITKFQSDADNLFAEHGKPDGNTFTFIYGTYITTNQPLETQGFGVIIRNYLLPLGMVVSTVFTPELSMVMYLNNAAITFYPSSVTQSLIRRLLHGVRNDQDVANIDGLPAETVRHIFSFLGTVAEKKKLNIHEEVMAGGQITTVIPIDSIGWIGVQHSQFNVWDIYGNLVHIEHIDGKLIDVHYCAIAQLIVAYYSAHNTNPPIDLTEAVDIGEVYRNMQTSFAIRRNYYKVDYSFTN